jgi:signal transduction histidine kinase/CheY-like chemotaxis protein
MWAIWNQSGQQDKKLIEITKSLLEDTLQRLIFGSAVILLIWFFVTGLISADLLLWKYWLAFLFAIAIVRLCTWMAPRKLIPAAILWLSGLFMINTLFVFLLRRPEAIFFYSLLPLQAVIVLGWPASAAATLAVGAALMGVELFSGQSYPQGYLIVVMSSCIITAFLGWISASSLLNEVRNSIYFSRMAQSNLEEAREHRGHMFKLLKDLDVAYYRLERANAALVAAWKEAETAEKFKAEFVTYVSHEMRTPLNLVLGFSETILTSPESYANQVLPGLYRADVNKIYQNANHMLALVEDVIDLSRANVNRIPLTREKVDVKGLVNEAVEMVSEYIQTKGLTLQVEVDESLDILLIDRLRIRQVLLNLLVNAARFTTAGWIRLEARLGDSQALFKVSDTGKGINPVEIAQVFQDFHTTGRQDEAWHAGSGLGLPISKKLIELHGGEMGVTSEPQQGATFWFSLPAETAAEPAHNPRLPVAPFSALPYQSRITDRIVILVHEDSGAGRILQRATRGLRVQQVNDWTRAVEMARDLRAQAVIAAQPGPEPLPAGTVCIQFPLPGTRQLEEKLGAAEVLEKPVLQNDLLEAVGRVAPQAKEILVVDDDSEITDLFQRFLAPRCGAEHCRVANDGRAALKKIAERRPDLIILDLVMPEVDGYEVLAELHSRAETAAIPVLIVSGTVGETYEAHIASPLRMQRVGGLQLAEACRVIESAVNALSPGWE